VAARAAVIETVQVAVVPVHAPLQPVKSELPAGAAVKVTMAPLVNDVEQTVPQLMPAGELVTVPVPVPALVTVSANDGSENVAVTDRAALIATVQVDAVPVQLPVQPPKIEPPAEAAVSVTEVPLVYEAEHVVPQLMPVGELVTVPLPLPDFVTVRANVGAVKVAVTDVAVLTVTVQVPVPVQPPPLQPANVEPVAAAAVSVTGVPLVYVAEHVAPQLMPEGALLTVPLPVPALETVNVDVVPTPVPVTRRDTESPLLAVKLTFVLDTTALVGVKRTVTVAVAPLPVSVKGLPETMLKGAPTDAEPVTVPARVFWIVKVWVAKLPRLTFPKPTVPVGLTDTLTCATPLAAGEQALSVPEESTAVIDTLYVEPLVKPVSRKLTC
jgi:hypothetical protein